MLRLSLASRRSPLRGSSLLRRHLSTTSSRPSSDQRPHLLDELTQRGLVQSITSRSLRAHLSAPSSEAQNALSVKRTVYSGVDPSARSLHVGNLLPLMALLHFARYGHRSLALIGGATGSIGDPSGRSTERSALDKAELDRNVASISNQLREFFGRAQEYIERRQDLVEPSSSSSARAATPTPMEAAAQSADGGIEAELAAERAFCASSTEGASAPFPPAPGNAAVDVPQAEDAALGDRLTTTPALDVRLVNNLSWFSGLGVLEFLGTVGRHARIQTMMSRDSVKSRLVPPRSAASEGEAAAETDEANGDALAVGLSFTEFSYQLLQAYDFSVLHSGAWNCSIQIGGSDQMGNIMAGVDLIRRLKAASPAAAQLAASSSSSSPTSAAKPHGGQEKYVDPAYGLTLPLLTTSSGAKFGKSAGNAIWLSPSLLSDFEFYQFFLRSRDDEVEKYLLALTLLPVGTVRQVMGEHAADRKRRGAQRKLAGEVTELVRGVEARKRAEMATRVMFETDLRDVDVDEVVEAFRGTQVLVELGSRDEWVGEDVTKLAAKVGLVKSRADAKRALSSGGLYLNNVALPSSSKSPSSGITTLDPADLLGPPSARQFAILRVGKTEHRVVVVPS
ncbi:uncharacterized protein PFL1_03123 [Pseudozyma flocculosa PF-1]|uniref:tyrosine--tRNA ligase n=2 Tax=Pseudozyma flocculosa TaxID=84751 RepID=A0A5C3F1X9_9BASI|nr:uncharacterized protein PFL1_03123 [Pseudozyma flocculosa PF-1]EPQ29368.1 hypothetical protein PFL1_03123 [Pseudozyma flocculosa PF-1]SPO37886.1 related to tyrosyl-tRNA synthetase, mitochondrial precursor [Pseudozyma flocculosa]